MLVTDNAVKREHRQARLCWPSFDGGLAVGKSDARNDLFAAPVSSERVTEPFGGLHTEGRGNICLPLFNVGGRATRT